MRQNEGDCKITFSTLAPLGEGSGVVESNTVSGIAHHRSNLRGRDVSWNCGDVSKPKSPEQPPRLGGLSLLVPLLLQLKIG
jgi:hypothetical protein